jgi:hypothetical protein
MSLTNIVFLFSISIVVPVFVVYILIKNKPKRRERLIEGLVLQVKSSGVRFYGNIVNDIFGVCRADSHWQAEKTHSFLVEKGKLNGWDRVVIQAFPTFTFAGSVQTKRPIHTGLVTDLEDIVNGILVKMTGYGRHNLSEKEFQRVMRAMLIRDSRIYVPFSDNGSNGQADLDKYGKTSLEDARRTIHN